jgi:hypothetical protein
MSNKNQVDYFITITHYSKRQYNVADVDDNAQDQEDAGFELTQGSSTQQQGRKFRNSDSQPILPVCIRQIINAQYDANDSSFKIGPVEVYVVSFVAKVLTVDIKPQKVIFVVYDGSGAVEVNLWVDQNAKNYQSQQKDFAQYANIRNIN